MQFQNLGAFPNELAGFIWKLMGFVSCDCGFLDVLSAEKGEFHGD